MNKFSPLAILNLSFLLVFIATPVLAEEVVTNTWLFKSGLIFYFWQ